MKRHGQYRRLLVVSPCATVNATDSVADKFELDASFLLSSLVYLIIIYVNTSPISPNFTFNFEQFSRITYKTE